MLKKILLTFTVLAAFTFVFASNAYAAPHSNSHPNSINYSEGVHLIPIPTGEEDPFWIEMEGWDFVMRAGQSGNVQQWFWNADLEPPTGYHSVWLRSKNGECPPGAVEISDNWQPEPDEFTYCVITNNFTPPAHNFQIP